MTAERSVELLRSYLASGNLVAKRLATSIGRIASLMPLDGRSVERLSDDEEERLDAFLFRFSSLTATVQDHVGRAVLMAEEEDLSTASRKDQRLLLEKFGALDQGLEFGVVAELRNRLAHSYPDDPDRQAEVMNLVADKAVDLLASYNGMLAYAGKFGVGADLEEIQLLSHDKRNQP